MANLLRYIKILILIFGFYACGEKSSNIIIHKKVFDTYKPYFTESLLINKLEILIKQNSQDSLKQFFTDWNIMIKPNSNDFIEQNEIIKAVYDSYKTFYKPYDLLKLGNWQWGNNLYSESKYFVVQNKIYYAVIPSDYLDEYSWALSHKDSICNFRPPLQIENNKVLYLTSEYEKSITFFLGTESTELGMPNLMTPSRPKGESEKRYEMLRKYIPILHGHWGGYWHIETHPFVYYILFNNNLSLAMINFRVGYEGGEATLIRGINGWMIKESKETWIE